MYVLINSDWLSLSRYIVHLTTIVGEGPFFLGGGLGPQRGGSSVKLSTKMGGPYLFVSYLRGIQREGHTSFPELFNENLCNVAFHFSYRLSFSFHLL